MLPSAGPDPVRADPVTIMAPEELSGLASRMQRVIAHPTPWLGLGRVDLTPLTVVLVPDVAGFSQWSGGRVPRWGAGLTLPARRLIVIRANAGDPLQTLRHELAHLAFHSTIHVRVPLWFSEGYATLAAGEQGRLNLLQLNLAVALGRVPSLEALNGALRGSVADAGPAYALAGAAVADIAARHPSGSLEPILARLRSGEGFDQALLASTGFGMLDFDAAWRQAMRHRYNLGVWLMAGGAWVLVLSVVLVLAAQRRRRDAPRRAALDIGWRLPEVPDGAVPEDDDCMTTPSSSPHCLDRSGRGC
ncbi:MAG TPA: hypothetical protein VFN22_05210 [Gemmatimonadales bacterium]|nr:hypothetical protein [Gemmatimonadales bacterium]